MMVKKMVLLCKSTQTSLAQKIWPQTEHPLTEVEECQAWALSTESHSEGVFYPPSLVSWPPHLLRDVSLPVIEPVLVVSLLI